MTVRRAIATTVAAVAGAVVGTAALAVAAMAVSPWPSALLIRRAFDRGGHATNAALAARVPDGVTSVQDVPYDPSDPASLLDVHRPSAPAGAGPLPTVVWVHGGGWVSGGKDQVANYLRILAARGFVVVAVDYHLAPRARYPRPVHQVLTALTHLLDHADELELDTSRVVLAGDSAGSQIAAQVAAAVTDPAYAAALGVAPTLRRENLRAALLHCGAYDLDPQGADGTSRSGELFVEAVLWSYTGRRSARDDPVLDLASVLRHVTPAFPPSYLSGGDDDPLTPHGLAFAERLRELDVELEADFPTGEAAPLGHEFQFDLATRAGEATLERSVAFLRRHTA